MTLVPNEMLDRYLNEKAHVLEWGSGASTWYIARKVSTVVSIEHNSGYYESNKNRMPANVKCRLIGPDLPVGGKEDGTHAQFKTYVDVVAEYPGHFDIVVIDGRARPWCAYMAGKTQRQDCVFFLHDYKQPQMASREDYDKVKEWFRIVEECNTLVRMEPIGWN